MNGELSLELGPEIRVNEAETLAEQLLTNELERLEVVGSNFSAWIVDTKDVLNTLVQADSTCILSYWERSLLTGLHTQIPHVNFALTVQNVQNSCGEAGETHVHTPVTLKGHHSTLLLQVPHDGGTRLVQRAAHTRNTRIPGKAYYLRAVRVLTSFGLRLQNYVPVQVVEMDLTRSSTNSEQVLRLVGKVNGRDVRLRNGLQLSIW